MKKIFKSSLRHKTVRLFRKVEFIFFPYLREEPKEVIKRRQRFYNQFIDPNDLI